MRAIVGMSATHLTHMKALSRILANGRWMRTRLWLPIVVTVLAAAACSSAVVAPMATPEPHPDQAPPSPVAPSPTPTAETEASEPISSIFRELNPSGPKALTSGRFRQLISRDVIRPIYTPFIEPPEDAALADDDLVMGVSIGGESRAYPVRTMRFREMANDVVGGVPILVTW